jgi:hypothetical protein
MYKVTEINHAEGTKEENVFSFETKKQAKAYVKANGKRWGYDFFQKENRSIELRMNF